MAHRLLPSAGYLVMPWSNGRGSTREIAREPLDGDFAWRLSMATVADDAPFSTFPGVTRTLAVVAGGALDLVVDGERTRLAEGGPAATFSGESPAYAVPAAGIVTDLNLMVRGGLRGSIEPLTTGRVIADGVTMIVDLATLDTLVVLDEVDWVGAGYLVRIR